MSLQEEIDNLFETSLINILGTEGRDKNNLLKNRH